MLSYNMIARDVLRKQNRHSRILILADFDSILNGRKTQGDLMRTIDRKMRDLVAEEATLGSAVGKNRIVTLSGLPLSSGGLRHTLRMNNSIKNSCLCVRVTMSTFVLS